MAQAEASTADPRPATVVMIATYVVAGAGVFIGFGELAQDPPSLTWGALLAVGGGGLLSFVGHSLLHRSDAARMGWDLGARNNFQIQVGLANLAWGLGPGAWWRSWPSSWGEDWSPRRSPVSRRGPISRRSR